MVISFSASFSLLKKVASLNLRPHNASKNFSMTGSYKISDLTQKSSFHLLSYPNSRCCKASLTRLLMVSLHFAYNTAGIKISCCECEYELVGDNKILFCWQSCHRLVWFWPSPLSQLLGTAFPNMTCYKQHQCLYINCRQLRLLPYHDLCSTEILRIPKQHQHARIQYKVFGNL